MICLGPNWDIYSCRGVTLTPFGLINRGFFLGPTNVEHSMLVSALSIVIHAFPVLPALSSIVYYIPYYAYRFFNVLYIMWPRT